VGERHSIGIFDYSHHGKRVKSAGERLASASATCHFTRHPLNLLLNFGEFFMEILLRDRRFQAGFKNGR
jgi:hypothetical protein